MRRITSLIMIVAILSVTGIPVLPKASLCHAAEANSDCDTCHTDEHASHQQMAHAMHAPGTRMEHGMDHDIEHEGHGNHDAMQHEQNSHRHHDGQMQNEQKIEQQPQMHMHQKQLSAAEKDCRIECGCGCNRSVDGFPHLLAPHVATTIQFETGEQIARIEPAIYPVLYSLKLNDPPPPPETI